MPAVYQVGRVASNNVSSLRSPENDALIQVLKEARSEAKISQEELSRRIGQSITFMVKVERGTRRLDVVEFILVAKELGINSTELLQRVLDRI